MPLTDLEKENNELRQKVEMYENCVDAEIEKRYVMLISIAKIVFLGWMISSMNFRETKMI